MNANGTKYDNGKPMMSLIPAEASEMMAAALTFGAKKYGHHNFRSGIVWSRLVDADLRHTNAMLRGEMTDPESGLPHLAHALATKAMLAFMVVNRPDLNDLYKYEEKAEPTTPTCPVVKEIEAQLPAAMPTMRINRPYAP